MRVQTRLLYSGLKDIMRSKWIKWILQFNFKKKINLFNRRQTWVSNRQLNFELWSINKRQTSWMRFFNWKPGDFALNQKPDVNVKRPTLGRLLKWAWSSARLLLLNYLEERCVERWLSNVSPLPLDRNDGGRKSDGEINCDNMVEILKPDDSWRRIQRW